VDHAGRTSLKSLVFAIGVLAARRAIDIAIECIEVGAEACIAGCGEAVETWPSLWAGTHFRGTETLIWGAAQNIVAGAPAFIPFALLRLLAVTNVRTAEGALPATPYASIEATERIEIRFISTLPSVDNAGRPVAQDDGGKARCGIAEAAARPGIESNIIHGLLSVH